MFLFEVLVVRFTGAKEEGGKEGKKKGLLNDQKGSPCMVHRRVFLLPRPACPSKMVT
jgi:hypothetical protein